MNQHPIDRTDVDGLAALARDMRAAAANPDTGRDLVDEVNRAIKMVLAK